MMRVIRRAGTVGALLGIMLFGLGSPALATTGQDGPDPPKLGDPVGSNVSPHGGYGSTTSFCTQCHSIHGAAGEYALMWKASVVDTCNTCHGFPGMPDGTSATPTGRRVVLGATIGTASSRTAYDVSRPPGAHTLGETAVPNEDPPVGITQADWSFGWRRALPTTDATTLAGAGTAAADTGGLYCASCHTPHGDFGQAINTRKAWVRPASDQDAVLVDWANNTQVWTMVAGRPELRYLWNASGTWKFCTAPDGAGTCTNATITDLEGQRVYLYGYKLLSAFPNHTYSKVQSWGTDYRKRDESGWCAGCHVGKLSHELGGLAGVSGHPTACDYCHGNPTAAGVTPSYDFPHTSTMGNLLKDFADALCISCHTAGSLP